jgi:Mce-associated membrane protein
LPIALKRAGRRVVRRFTGLIVKRQRRESVSGRAEQGDVDNECELSAVTFDDGGPVDDTGEDDGAVIGTDSRGAPSSDAPDPTAPDGSEAEPADSAGEVSEPPITNPVKRLRLALVASALIVAVLGGLVGYLGYRGCQTRVAAHQRDLFLSVGRRAAINLTTISYTQAEADVARILDSATGTFHDDFQHRSQPFIDVVKRAESTSQGSVTAAGLESIDGDRAQVIVAVSVKTTNAGVPEEQPRGWRMRLDVQKVGDTAKVSDVQLVP